MNNLLIILAVLFISLFVILPLVEKTAKPVDAEKMQKYHKVFGILLGVMVIASVVRYCTMGAG